MDTAKVDIRKLQLLNDRINQCIDELNQVRLSVHGLSHTSAIGPAHPFGQVPFGQSPYGAVPFGGAGYVPGYAAPGAGAVLGQPFGQPLAAPLPVAGAGAFGIPGIGVAPAIGLSHTSAEAAWTDPYRQVSADPLLMARIVQTFPYAYQPGNAY